MTRHDDEVLRVEDLTVRFPRGGGLTGHAHGWLTAVDEVSFTIRRGETLALVGESGSGKTTTGRAVVRVQPTTSGRITLLGEDITGLSGRDLRQRRRHLQMVFQDPTGSLNPRRTVVQVLEESLRAHGASAAEAEPAAAELMEQVGLGRIHRDKYPHELSGGQRQRVGIARALSTRPSVVVCDEPVSSLDVSIQAQILLLLQRLQADMGLAYLFVSHDLAVVQSLAHRVAVMFRGRLVEIGTVDQVFSAPRHPYTAALLAAVPRGDPDARRSTMIGLRSASTDELAAAGCPFRTRCWAYEALGRPADCEETAPEVVLEPAPGETAAAGCHHSDEVAALATRELRAVLTTDTTTSTGREQG